MLTIIFNDNSGGKSWQDKVLAADDVWAEVKKALADKGVSLPKTPRRPDVRLIIDNVSGQTAQFLNPGGHAADKQEMIPATGDKCAVMVMIKGATLEAQNANAQKLFEQYDLGACGLTAAFVEDLKAGKLADLVAEAYGPAPFAAQAEKLVDLVWDGEGGEKSMIAAQQGTHAAYGARAATSEAVIHAQFHIYVKGTGTTPELVESDGMVIAVSEDYKTGKETTRPIVPSVARTYYGAHFDVIPKVLVHPDGGVMEIDIQQSPPAPAPPRSGAAKTDQFKPL